MADWQALIHCFDDADLLDGALASLPDAVPVHVVDGRYDTFAGDRDVTPAAPAVCDRHPNVTYHRPPDDLLPWGHAHRDAPDADRWPQFCEMHYSLSVIDGDVWTLKLDTDERLHEFSADLDALDPTEKYHATIAIEDHPLEPITGDVIYVPRLWMPDEWTFWTDDVMVPRDRLARDASAPQVRAVAHNGGNYRRANPLHRDAIRIDNVGHERPVDYHDRRADQLDRLYPA